MASPPRDSQAPQRLGRPPRGWVRKALGAKTETETVDAALDAIAFRNELVEGVRRLRAASGLKDVDRE